MSQSYDFEAPTDADGAKLLSPSNLKNSKQRFMSSDLSLLESGKFSDVKVVCGNQSWSLHKTIICERCRWFEEALNGDSETQEAGITEITITQFSPELIDVVVHYLYSGAIDTNGVHKCEGDSIFSKYVRLWATAEFFLLDSLQKDTIEAMEDHIEHRIKAISNLLQIFESAAIIKEFFCGVASAYNDFPHAKACQKVLIDYAHAIRFRLYRAKHFTDSIHKFPELASDLFLVSVTGNQSKWAGNSEGDLSSFSIQKKCQECKCGFSEPRCWYMDPQSTGGCSRLKDVAWKCETCVENSGYPWESRDGT